MVNAARGGGGGIVCRSRRDSITGTEMRWVMTARLCISPPSCLAATRRAVLQTRGNTRARINVRVLTPTQFGEQRGHPIAHWPESRSVRSSDVSEDSAAGAGGRRGRRGAVVAPLRACHHSGYSCLVPMPWRSSPIPVRNTQLFRFSEAFSGRVGAVGAFVGALSLCDSSCCALVR